MSQLTEIANSLTPQQIIKLVTNLGSDEYKETEDAIIFKTICHNIDVKNAKMKLYYYKKNHKFHCYTDCGDNFNIFTLFERRYQLLGIEYNFFKDIVLVISNEINFKLDNKNYFTEEYHSDFKYNNNKADVKITPLNSSLLNIYNFYAVPEWINDGISEQSMKDFNIKYSIDENKVIIPHYNINGDLIGIRGRALNLEEAEIAKYMPVQIEGKILSHPLGYNLYGLNFNKDNIKKSGMAIVAESEKAVLQYNTMFKKENNICVASCGSSFGEYQFELLLAAGATKILIAFDKEGETWKDKEKYYSKLKNICERYKNKCQMGFIWDSTNLLSLKDSPFDKGKEIFLKLYKGAIWVK